MLKCHLGDRLLLLPLVGGEDFLYEVRGDFFVVAGLDVEVGASAGYGAEVAGVGEHLDLGHLCLYELALAALLDAHRPTAAAGEVADRKSTRLNSSHANISYAVFCLK